MSAEADALAAMARCPAVARFSAARTPDGTVLTVWLKGREEPLRLLLLP